MSNDNLSYKNFLHGWIAGINAVIVSHPIDTIKTNIQEKKFINFIRIPYQTLFILERNLYTSKSQSLHAKTNP